MSITCQQTVRCPNCGSEAMRRYFTSEEAIYRACLGHHVIQTECNACDYLMVLCSRNGAVVEAQFPGTAMAIGSRDFLQNRSLAVGGKRTPNFLTSAAVGVLN